MAPTSLHRLDITEIKMRGGQHSSTPETNKFLLFLSYTQAIYSCISFAFALHKTFCRELSHGSQEKKGIANSFLSKK
jgi:hypothetical protein